MRIGVDLGGTKIEAIALGPGGETLARQRVPTPKDYQATVTAIADLVLGVERDLGQRGTVGVGTPGAPSRATGLMKNCNSVWLNGQPLPRDLESALDRPIRITNDANCFALSEAHDGAAAGARVVFGVIIGTGCGGGVVVDRACLTGPNAIAGEWGHNPLPWPDDTERPGPDCYCGLHGCIETFVSGTGLERDYQAATGQRLSAREIARAGTPESQAAVERYERRLAKALASIVNMLDPDVVVLGGGMSNVDRLYDTVPTLWPNYVFSDRVDTRLAKAVHGDSSGVRGAAWLWPDPADPA